MLNRASGLYKGLHFKDPLKYRPTLQHPPRRSAPAQPARLCGLDWSSGQLTQLVLARGEAASDGTRRGAAGGDRDHHSPHRSRPYVLTIMPQLSTNKVSFS